MKLKEIPAGDIRGLWKNLRPSLEEISIPAGDWIPEDIYCELVSGKAVLYMGYDKDLFQGYLITKVLGNSLYVWVAYGVSNGVFVKTMPAVVELCQEMRIKKVFFGSVRRGWEKLAPKLGFKPKVWEMAIPDVGLSA